MWPLRILVSGQVLTSRTETIEDFLRTRVRSLSVIGLAGPYQSASGRFTVYEGGNRVRERPLRMIRVKNKDSLWGLLRTAMAFANYLVQILRAGKSEAGPFDLFIGVSCFSAFAGQWLKRLGRVRKVVFYSIDYYPRPAHLGVTRVLVWVFRQLDRFCVRNSDLVWHITPRIAEGRMAMAGVPASSYPHLHVPLSYRESLLRSLPPEKVERWTIGFAGTITREQGLELLIEALPEVVKRLPEVRVRIVGQGPDAPFIEPLARQSACADRYVFHGFIGDEEVLLDLMARCAVAVAPWTQAAGNNIQYADPGKPKLYACLGVPCVITRGPEIADVMARRGAGVAIDYRVEELVDALCRVLEDDGRWETYRRKAAELGPEFVSEKILQVAMAQTLDALHLDR